MASELQRGIFNGKKFFVGQIVPSRSRYVAEIEENGGIVVRKEDQANILIGDHLKPAKSPTGSISYKYIDDSIQAGKEKSLDEYLVDEPPGVPRQIASKTIHSSSRRNPFTAAEDSFCYAYAQYIIGNKGKVGGNVSWQPLDGMVSVCEKYSLASSSRETGKTSMAILENKIRQAHCE
jgi:hypothetical protein